MSDPLFSAETKWTGLASQLDELEWPTFRAAMTGTSRSDSGAIEHRLWVLVTGDAGLKGSRGRRFYGVSFSGVDSFSGLDDSHVLNVMSISTHGP